MEFIILGLLMFKNMTIYELNASFGVGLKMIYSASYGSLQYSVKKLLKDGMISYMETVENGRNKKIYNINQNGIDYFYGWMLAKTKFNGTDKVILSKVYFLGLIEDNNKKREIITDLLESVKVYALELSKIKEENKNLSLPSNLMEIANYQLATLDYGIGAYEHSIMWLESLLKNLGE
jgi:DNA-binding PadR family transcriptional regulator